MTAAKPQPAGAKPSGTSSAPVRNPLLITVLLLAVIFALLFHHSFNPRLVAFSNDGPLGQMVTEMNTLPGAMTGLWVDVNWLGYETFTAPPGISTAMRLLVSPRVYLNVLYPAALLIVGVAACYCLRRMSLSPLA